MNTPPDELQAEISRLRATIAELREERDGLLPIVEHVASSLNCHCFTNGREVDAGVHRPSCWIGKAKSALTADVKPPLGSPGDLHPPQET